LYLSSSGTEGVFGGGKWCLLDAIRATGSIQAAVAKLGRSYRKAWGDIKMAEAGLGGKLVLTSRGGSGGGHAVLTDFALQLLGAWDGFRASVTERVEDAYAELVLPVMRRADSNEQQNRKRKNRSAP